MVKTFRMWYFENLRPTAFAQWKSLEFLFEKKWSSVGCLKISTRNGSWDQPLPEKVGAYSLEKDLNLGGSCGKSLMFGFLTVQNRLLRFWRSCSGYAKTMPVWKGEVWMQWFQKNPMYLSSRVFSGIEWFISWLPSIKRLKLSTCSAKQRDGCLSNPPKSLSFKPAFPKIKNSLIVVSWARFLKVLKELLKTVLKESFGFNSNPPMSNPYIQPSHFPKWTNNWCQLCSRYVRCGNCNTVSAPRLKTQNPLGSMDQKRQTNWGNSTIVPSRELTLEDDFLFLLGGIL